MSTNAMLRSLCWDPTFQQAPQQTNAGMPVYGGNFYDFETWFFKVKTKYDSYENKETKVQDRIELATKVIEGLTDDALKCAMDLGQDKVVAEQGVTVIAAASTASWEGKMETVIKELYREGSKRDGLLARQTGESMSSYTTRRKRWYRNLLSLDGKFRIPDHLQLEMLMDCSGLTEHQQQLPRLAAEHPDHP